MDSTPRPRLYSCKFCQTKLSFDDLMLHFRSFFCPARRYNDALECGEPDCYRVFSNHDNFKHHVLRFHPPTVIVVEDPPGQTIIGDDFETSSLLNVSDNLSEQLPFSTSESSIPEQQPHSDDEDVAVQPCVTLESFPGFLEHGLATIFSEMLSNPQVPLNYIQKCHVAYSNHYSSIITEVLRTLMRPDCTVPLHDAASTLVTAINGVSKKFRSHAMRLKHFQHLGSYIPPSRVIVGYRTARLAAGGVANVPCFAQHVPMGSVLSKLFSVPNMMTEIDSYLATCQEADPIIVNIVQGESWKNQTRGIQLQDNERLYPLILFQDDFEVGNPLGSHATIHKLGAVYFWLPCLPKRIASQLSYIFVTLLYHSSDLKNFGNERIFREVISDLNNLSLHGVNVEVDGVQFNLKFRLAAITGDNLGLHTILGFSESFMANHPCRVCRCHKQDTRSMLKENPSMLRNCINYAQDVATNDVSETGIKSACVWNGVHYFDLFTMTAVDVLHDLLEGACVYVLEVVLHGLIAARLVPLDTLNSMIESFNYGPDRDSKPPLITPSAKVKIKMSASECMVFVRYLPMFVGVDVPRGNEYWKLFILLKRILSIAMSDAVRPGLAKDFSWYVEEFNELYIKLSRTRSLPPKFHHLVHYHRMMKLFGPLRHLWAMRFEGKHRVSKISAHASASRVNVCQTVMNRHQWQLNHSIFKNTLKSSRYEIFKKANIKVGERWHILDQLGLPRNANLRVINSFSIDGITVREGDVICTELDEANDNIPKFIRLHSLLYDVDRKVPYYKASSFDTIEFDDHLFAYKVKLKRLTVYGSYPRHPVFPFPNTYCFLKNKSSYVVFRNSID